jgi:hypothetical protein
MATIGKLQISQTDAKSAPAAAAPFDDVARTDRKPARKTID